MPRNSTFRHYNYSESSSKRKTFSVSQFYGVEYTRSQLECKDYHATDIKNIVYKDKVNQKRSGYEEVAIAPNTTYINGYFEFYDEDGNFHKIMHIGTNLYEVSNLGKDSKYYETNFSLISSGMANHKSQAFASKGILYILDGTSYKYLKLNGVSLALNNVAGSSIVYVPTTTRAITEKSLNLSSATSFEDVNLLTKWKKNKMRSIEVAEPQDTYEFVLDSKCVYSSSDYDKIVVEVLYTDATTKQNYINEYKIATNVTNITKNNNSYVFSTSTQMPLYLSTYLNNGVVSDGDKNLIFGFIRFGNNTTNASLILFNNPQNDAKEDNITITFPTSSDYTKINNCTFGIVYNDRLFVSGNPNYPNMDWHTQSTINYANSETYGDFTYFSDLDYCAYGSDNTAVVGYDIYSDGDLIVVKEPSRYEATFYRRHKELVNAKSYTGEEATNQGTTLYEEGYPSFAINSMGGDGGISNRSIINFLGETLILTNNGLKKLYTKQNTYNKEKNLVDVSSNINLAITKEDLSNAFIFIFKDKLLLKVGDYVYVAYETLKENNEYEWYKLEGIDADEFFEIDNELYFSDTSGNICRFNTDEYYYKDRDRVFTSLGSTLPNANEIVISNTYADEISDGDKVIVLAQSSGTFAPMYYRITTVYSVNYPNETNCRYSVSDGKTKITLQNVNDNLVDGLNVYINGDNVIGNYKLKIVDDTSPYEYYILDTDGNYVDFTNSIGFNIYVSTEDKELIVSDFGYDETQSRYEFKLKNELDESVSLYTPLTTTSFYCIITHETNVDSHYVTKPYDMGSIGYEKNIWQYTIANDSNLNSITKLGYLFSRKQGGTAFNNSGSFTKDSDGFWNNDYNFSTISFLNNNLPHIYTRYRSIPNVSFIRFTFKNDEDTNMVLSQLSLLYTISGQIRGNK